MEKASRRLKDGVHWEVNHQWIVEQIVKMCNLKENDKERKLIMTPIKDNYTHEQTLFFSLEGSPSRGYAIYAGNKLCVISWGFDKKKVFKDILIEGNTPENVI